MDVYFYLLAVVIFKKAFVLCNFPSYLVFSNISDLVFCVTNLIELLNFFEFFILIPI